MGAVHTLRSDFEEKRIDFNHVLCKYMYIDFNLIHRVRPSVRSVCVEHTKLRIRAQLPRAGGAAGAAHSAALDVRLEYTRREKHERTRMLHWLVFYQLRDTKIQLLSKFLIKN
jgi:hypothetical protein